MVVSIHRIRRWVAILLVTFFAMGAAGAAASDGPHVILPPHNPVSNWNPGRVSTNSILVLVNAARRAQEGLGPLPLNLARYNRLSIPEQLFVLANLERVTRGEAPAYGLWTVLNRLAATGARLGRDPLPPSNWNRYFASIWSSAPNSRTNVALFSDFGWMYQDGAPPFYGTVNFDCLRRGMPGCWGHRDAILEAKPDSSSSDKPLVLLAGAAGGVRNYRGSSSLTMDFTWVAGVPTTGVTYTWAEAVRFLGLTTSTRPAPTTTTLPETTTTTLPGTTTTTLPGTTTTTLPSTTTTTLGG